VKYNLLHKINDRVQIKSLAWYNKNQINGYVNYTPESDIFTESMRKLCGKQVIIYNIDKAGYRIALLNGDSAYCDLCYDWYDWMFEGMSEDLLKEKLRLLK